MEFACTGAVFVVVEVTDGGSELFVKVEHLLNNLQVHCHTAEINLLSFSDNRSSSRLSDYIRVHTPLNCHMRPFLH